MVIYSPVNPVLLIAIYGFGLSGTNAVPAAAGEPPAHVSCDRTSYQIEITVKNVKHGVGLMTAELYPSDKDAFLTGSGRLSIVRFATKTPETRFCLNALEPGQYAVSVYHDVNANTDLDKGFLGLPAEPWGLSNNPPVRIKLPDIADSLFLVGSSGTKISIDLH